MVWSRSRGERSDVEAVLGSTVTLELQVQCRGKRLDTNAESLYCGSGPCGVRPRC
jgi:hypothetical protein